MTGKRMGIGLFGDCQSTNLRPVNHYFPQIARRTKGKGLPQRPSEQACRMALDGVPLDAYRQLGAVGAPVHGESLARTVDRATSRPAELGFLSRFNSILAFQRQLHQKEGIQLLGGHGDFGAIAHDAEAHGRRAQIAVPVIQFGTPVGEAQTMITEYTRDHFAGFIQIPRMQ